ncbi:MAG: metallophosphoesterase [Bacteroidota bacterium]
MKTGFFLIFVSIVLAVYAAVNYYIFIRGWQALSGLITLRYWYLGAFLFLSSSYILARFLEYYAPSPVSRMFVWIGSFWLAAMLYFFLIVFLVDIVRMFNYFFHFLPLSESLFYGKLKIISISAATGIVAITILAGYINAVNVRVKRIDLQIAKHAGTLHQLNIVMASDIHLGNLVGKNRMGSIVAQINALNPDIVLFAGDVTDEDLRPVIENNLGAMITSIRSKYGVYAITGNHEYIGGAVKAVKYLEEHGVKMLRDTAITIDNSFCLAGRNDKDSRRFTGIERKPFDEVLKDADKNLPLILMDHQPFNLELSENAGVDLHLSGHTHNGQMWPLNYITGALFELDWGYKKRGNTNYYVSCGAGTWGPPVRTGNRPEIVNIVLHFME